MWSFAVQQACEMLLCRKLRLAGDKKVPRCWPFGTYVALRVPGKTKGFGPFEVKGKLGRLLWQDTGSRLCYAVGPTGELVKGFAAAPVLYQEDPDGVTEEQIQELLASGWRRKNLEDGAPAWLHEEDGVLSLVCPCVVEVAETAVFPANVADADVVSVIDMGMQTPQEEVFHDCATRRVQFRDPEVEEIVHYQVRNITVRTANRAKALRARRHPELDVYAEAAQVLEDTCNSKDVPFGSSALPGFRLDANTAGVWRVVGCARWCGRSFSSKVARECGRDATLQDGTRGSVGSPCHGGRRTW
eukprot:4943902-Amphidinium_carterae.1